MLRETCQSIARAPAGWASSRRSQWGHPLSQKKGFHMLPPRALRQKKGLLAFARMHEQQELVASIVHVFRSERVLPSETVAPVTFTKTDHPLKSSVSHQMSCAESNVLSHSLARILPRPAPLQKRDPAPIPRVWSSKKKKNRPKI